MLAQATPGVRDPDVGRPSAADSTAAGAAHNAYTAAYRQYRAGNLTEALSAVDAALTHSPRDVQLRFLRGVLLADTQRTAEAIESFRSLTEDFPELPEPYNNLAVLHAGTGELDKARGALESALRALPDYSTAHENLGDVYVRMAMRAYDRAAKVDPAARTAQAKLTMVREMVQKTLSPTAPKP